MPKLIEFPPRMACPLCAIPLRPATAAEIRADLQDPKRRQIALLAAQGDLEWNPSEELGSLRDIAERGSWLFRCDNCNNRTLWSRMHEDQ